MLLIVNYLNQQLANTMPILTIFKLVFILIHTASNFAVSIYLILSLMLILFILAYMIYNNYDKVLYIQSENVIYYLALLLSGTIIKNYILFTRVVLFLNTVSEQLLFLLIQLLFIIMDFMKYSIHTLKQQPVGDVIIFIVFVKMLYSILKEAIAIAVKNDLYEKMCDITDSFCSFMTYVLNLILLILLIAVICVLYYYIIYIQYMSMITIQNTDYETLNEILDNHLFK